MACCNGRIEVARFLEEHGADVNMKNNVSTAACGLTVMVEMDALFVLRTEVDNLLTEVDVLLVGVGGMDSSSLCL
jgi:hypothetical protein